MEDDSQEQMDWQNVERMTDSRRDRPTDGRLDLTLERIELHCTSTRRASVNDGISQRLLNPLMNQGVHGSAHHRRQRARLSQGFSSSLRTLH